jgi:ABC-2 type transport system ATP-binding protein
VTGRAAVPLTGADAGDGSGGWGATDISVWHEKALALDGVSLRARRGEVTAVVGGDGAGKTTLLRCLAGALAPDHGQVSSPGAARIGFLPSGSGVYPDLTVGENLAFRAAAYGLSQAVARERAAEYLDRAGLAAVRGRLAGQLSGGMRQKLGVIAAMLHRPELLILDEPTTGVDPVSRSDLWWLVARAAAGGAAVVLATTYLDEAQRATAVLFLDGGRVLAAGTPEEIVAAVPGSLRSAQARPDGQEGLRAWRRGGRWRVWDPAGGGPAAGGPAGGGAPAGEDGPADQAPTGGAGAASRPGQAGPAGEAISPDLQDAVTIAALARELATAGGRS